MGCDYYRLEGENNFIHFCESSAQDDIPCQCTFPGNNIAAGQRLDAYEVASLAMLGATLVLLNHDELTGPAFWPECLPEWVISEVRRVCGIGPMPAKGADDD